MTGRPETILSRAARPLALALGLAALTLAAPAARAQSADEAPAADQGKARGKASGKASGKNAGRGKGKGQASGKQAGKGEAPAEAPKPIPGPTLGGDPEPARCNPGSDTESGQFHVEEQDGQKVYVIDKAITVCGKVPRPLVAYVLQPRSINWEFEGMKQEFLPKIRESVKKAPF